MDGQDDGQDQGGRVLWAFGGAEAAALAERVARASNGTLRLARDDAPPAADRLTVLWDRPERAAEAAITGRADPVAALESWCAAAAGALAVRRGNRAGTTFCERRAVVAALPLFMEWLGLAPLPADPADPPEEPPTDPIVALVAAHALAGHDRARDLAAALEAESQPLRNDDSADPLPSLSTVLSAFHAARTAQDTARAEAETLRDQLAERDAAADASRKEAETARAEAEALRDQLAQRDAAHDAARKEAETARAEAETLRDQVAERDAAAGAARKEAETARAEAAALRETVKTVEAQSRAMLDEMALIEGEARTNALERAAAREAATHAEAEVARLMGSRSMRLTAPLRRVAAKLRGH